jgi:hypothetical protein
LEYVQSLRATHPFLGCANAPDEVHEYFVGTAHDCAVTAAADASSARPAERSIMTKNIEFYPD